MLTLTNEDCMQMMARLDDNSIDAIVTDPPYGLAFMGKKWDYDVPSIEIWQECLRVLKPGGHLLAFAGTRTQHRMAVRIEDAGFEIRDMIMWVYGQGFPKSLDIGKAINKVDGIDEKKWEGFGTSLKPSIEPITVARKPLQGTVAENVLMWGTGGINIDGCRVGTNEIKEKTSIKPERKSTGIYGDFKETQRFNGNGTSHGLGRFPANLIHDGSEEVVGMFPETASGTGSIRKKAKGLFGLGGDGEHNIEYGDSGSAARFFYQAKADKGERGQGNTHPTVKPVDLMRYLCRLVTPPGGTILEPFAGSGTTLIAAYEEGFSAIGCELSEEYYNIAQERIKAHTAQQKLF